MASITYGLAKGLKEPCYPYRQARVFGAELNTPNADGWNCPPILWDSTSNYDLSTLSKSREVLVALLLLQNATGGSYTFSFKWYRERDNALLATWSGSYSCPPGGWVYGYSYIGYVDWEISENGSYYVDMQVTGPDSRTSRQYFTITGIVEKPLIPLVGGTKFMAGIVDYLVFAQDWLIEAFYTVSDWVWPFYLLATSLDWLQYAFGWLAYHFSNFSIWVSATGELVANILSWATLQGMIRSWLPGLETALAWFSNWWENVLAIVDNWWLARKSDVQDWINAAIAGAEGAGEAWLNFWNNLWPDLLATVNGLSANWSDFWRVTFPTLVNFSWLTTWWNTKLSDIDNLIRTAFALRESLWAGWQDIKDQVIEFFADPWAWLYNKFDDFIERFW